LKPATGSGRALWAHQRIRALPAPNSFDAFWGEYRPLVSGESGVEDVYIRRTLHLQITRYTNILGCRRVGHRHHECPDTHKVKEE